MNAMRGKRELNDRCLFRLTGEDRIRYLNGQVTNDVRKATDEAAIYACVTNAKGKLEADLFVSPGPGDEAALWVDGPGELREELQVRLEKYIIADDVELEDVTGETVLWHVLGGPEVAGMARGGWARRADRFGVEGWDVIGRRNEVNWDESVPELAAEDLERLRIDRAVGIWGAELGPDILPQEADLQDRAVDFTKGCYIGQEVISRIKSVGRVNKLLCRLQGDGDAGRPRAGDGLWAGDTEVGRLTSVAPGKSDEGRINALGYVKRGYQDPGTELACRGDDPERTCRLTVRSAPNLESEPEGNES